MVFNGNESSKQRVFEFFIGVAGKLEIVAFNGIAHALHELAAEDQ